MQFELFVAARYLRAKRRQAVIGVITVISIVGVTAGVASLIVALAINNGFRQDLQDRLLGSTSQINLLRVDADGIRNWQPLLSQLEKQPHVVAGAPAIYEQVLISRGARAQGAMLKGIIPREENKVSELLNSVKVGSAATLAGPDSAPTAQTLPDADEPNPLSARVTSSMAPVVLGKDMADQLGASVGSLVTVTSPQGELTPFALFLNTPASKLSAFSAPALTAMTTRGHSFACPTHSTCLISVMWSPCSSSRSMTSTKPRDWA